MSGKYAKNKRARRRRLNPRFVALVSSMVILVSLVVGGTIAYLVDNTSGITNTFEMGEVEVEITEEFDGNVKNNVQIKNTGDVSAKIRAMVVVTWQSDEDNSIYPNAPVLGDSVTDENGDYYAIYNTTDWTYDAATGWYTYKNVVAAGGTTNYLLTSCQPTNPPAGYHLVVDVIAEAIQAEGGASF